jgi:hypothetical protein
MSMPTGSRFIFESSEYRAIVQDMENSFYNSMCLEDASSYDEIELISCLLQTLVNGDKLNKCFKDYLVCCLRDTKKELFEVEKKLAKALEEVQRLKEKNRELIEKQGAKK